MLPFSLRHVRCDLLKVLKFKVGWDMDERTQEKLRQIRLRKLECQRHLRVLEQKLAGNPRDVFARREMERTQELLADLEERERHLLGEINQTGGKGDETATTESKDPGGG